MAAEPRLTSDFWLQAYMQRLRAAGIPYFLRARGDATAGALLVKVNTLDGSATLWSRMPSLDGGRTWDVLADGDDAAVEAAIDRQRGFDPDLWVLELEDTAGRHLLDSEGLA